MTNCPAINPDATEGTTDTCIKPPGHDDPLSVELHPDARPHMDGFGRTWTTAPEPTT